MSGVGHSRRNNLSVPLLSCKIEKPGDLERSYVCSGFSEFFGRKGPIGNTRRISRDPWRCSNSADAIQRVAVMARNLLSVLGVGVVALAITGCANSTVFRGQCPTEGCGTGGACDGGMCNNGPGGGACPGGPGACYGGGGCPGGPGACYGGAWGAGAGQGGACYAGPGYGRNCRSGACRGRGCKSCMNLPFHPVHRNYVDYKMPKNLSYPHANTPAAIVQYPYYTLRGPTDFFMK